MRRALAAVALAAALAGCGGGSGKTTHVSLLLDWTPNADHVGFYFARDTGLFRKEGIDVAIRAPSDPTTPLKLVAAGRTDLAVSYEQEVFLAAEKGLPVQAVAAVVGRPLNSIISIDPQVRSIGDLGGRKVGITGVPADYAALDTALSSAGLKRTDVDVVTVGYNLLPALLSRKVDAVLGVYRNVEGVQLRLRGLDPTVIPLDRAGVPPYDELVLVANAKRLGSGDYARSVERFVHAFLAGTAGAQAHPKRAVAVMQRVTASDPKFLRRSTAVTLGLLGNGCLDVSAWQRFGQWMLRSKLLKERVPADEVATTRFLPSGC